MRIYSLLLQLYPRWFRERHEAGLLEVFASECAEHRYRGAPGAIRFWLHIVCDLAVSVWRVRVRGVVPRDARDTYPRRTFMDTLAQDFRLACRQLARRPGFTAVATLSLAIGIGGTATIVGFLDGFVLNPFPYPDAARVVGIGVTFPRVSEEERFIEALSAAESLDIGESSTIGNLAIFDLGNRNISGGDRPERLFTALAVTDLFQPFGLRPALGRGFTAQELAPGGPAVAVISYRIWQSRFGGDTGMVGRVVRVNGAPTTVVGIMPKELLILGTDLWLPMGVDPLAMPRNGRQLTLIGRLAPGASLDAANAELATIANRVARTHGAEFEEYDGWRLAATPWAESMMRDIKPFALVLLAAVTLVLLIACVNLSNLMLARASTRQREIAVRLALGAARSRIARLLLTEVSVLAVLGAAGGLVIANAGLAALVRFMPAQAQTLGLTASLNGRVLAWTALFTIASAIIVALLPVFQSTRTDPHEAIKGEGRGTTSARAPQRLRHALIVAEVALSVTLLCGAGLFVRSFVRVQQVEPGFEPRNLLTMRLTLPQEKYQNHAINDFFQRLVDRMETTPGVRAAAVASQLPPRSPFSTEFRIEGAMAADKTIPTTLLTEASHEYFSALGIPVVSGRAFTEHDRASTPRVAVVNEAFVARFLPGVAPLGQRLTIGAADRRSEPMEIVGVVADVKNRGNRLATGPELFMPLLQQEYNNQMLLVVRTEGDALAMLPTVRQQIAAIDPEQPIYAIQTMEDSFAEAAFRYVLSMVLFGVFALVAVSLAAIGIYGVMSYAVSARTQEIGVRMAIGASRREVVWLVLGQALRLTGLGAAIGLGLVFLAGGAIRRMLFEVRPSDPATLVAAVVLLGGVALAAGWLPAWRASRVEPVEALRYE